MLPLGALIIARNVVSVPYLTIIDGYWQASRVLDTWRSLPTYFKHTGQVLTFKCKHIPSCPFSERSSFILVSSVHSSHYTLCIMLKQPVFYFSARTQLGVSWASSPLAIQQGCYLTRHSVWEDYERSPGNYRGLMHVLNPPPPPQMNISATKPKVRKEVGLIAVRLSLTAWVYIYYF